MVTLDSVPIAANQDCHLGIPGDAGLTWHSGRVLGRANDVILIESETESLRGLVETPGAEIAVEIWRAGDARYTLRALVSEVELTPNSEVARLTLRVIDCDRIQRRSYFRVPVMLTVSDAHVLAEEGVEQALTLHIYDISAGGMGARSIVRLSAECDLPLSVGSELRLILDVPGEAEPFSLRANVVRVGEVQTQSSHGVRFEIGAAFFDVAPPIRERLIHAVLRVQHLHARRGLL